MPESPAPWISVRIHPSSQGHARYACMAALFVAGAQGIHEDGLSLVTHFPPDTDLVPIQLALMGADELVRMETSPVPDVDWSEAWKIGIGTHTMGALTVAPPWLAHDLDRATTIVIEPGMAFGTGDHPTTRGVIRLLPSVLRHGDIVADLGAGSAVLAIAAAKLGAQRVYAIELDHDAIANAEDNVDKNGVAGIVHVFEADAASLLPLIGPMRVILANIISSVLIDLLPVIAANLTDDGAAILSGILLDEREMMMTTLRDHGWRIVNEDNEGIWWSVSIAAA